MARYLVTGGGGFIGSNLVEELLKRGEFVRVLDNFATGRRNNLAPFAADIELIEGDVRSYHIVQKAVAGMDYVLHQAALPSVPRSINDPLTSNEVNVVGTLNLLQAAVEHNIRRFVFASSSSVYGDNPVSPKVETMIPNPKSPYAVSKLAGEKYCQVFYQIYGLETVGLRYFNVFGPRQDPNSQYSAVIPKFVRALQQGQSPTIYGDGTQSRDFTYVQNNVRANLLACEAPGVGGKVFNIACGTNFSLNTLLHELNAILGTNVQARYEAPRRGDVMHSTAGIAAAKEELGYTPQVSFEEGLRLLVARFEK
jgi:UDP-glucose 4-epimerase